MIAILFLCSIANAQPIPTLDITEEDGSPKIYNPYEIRFPEDTLTDNTDGTVSVDAGTVTDITRCDTADNYCFVYEDNVLKLYVQTVLQAQWPITGVEYHLLLDDGSGGFKLLLDDGSGGYFLVIR